MNELVYAAIGVGAFGATCACHAIARYISRSRLSHALPTHVYEWSWVGYKEGGGFECPKCEEFIARTSIVHPTYCECAEYHDGHFHITCTACKYAWIELPADHEGLQ